MPLRNTSKNFAKNYFNQHLTATAKKHDISSQGNTGLDHFIEFSRFLINSHHQQLAEEATWQTWGDQRQCCFAWPDSYQPEIVFRWNWMKYFLRLKSQLFWTIYLDCILLILSFKLSQLLCLCYPVNVTWKLIINFKTLIN